MENLKKGMEESFEVSCHSTCMEFILWEFVVLTRYSPPYLAQRNKQVLIDAVVHAVNEDYVEMAGDFTRLGFLAPGTDVTPIVPALEAIWQNSTGKGLADFNFRSVTGTSHPSYNLV